VDPAESIALRLGRLVCLLPLSSGTRCLLLHREDEAAKLVLEAVCLHVFANTGVASRPTHPCTDVMGITTSDE